ncbi:MAG TPA: tetratricopeptide repeat protein, partial [Firmicutes bacterium]|nr:tetratricopeptide repeat protein [Bacillota bacterium]
MRIFIFLCFLVLTGCSEIFICCKPQKSPFKSYTRALLFEKEGKLDKALELYKEAICGGLKTSYIYSKIGKIYLKKNEFEKAEKYFKKGIRIDSECEECYLGLGVSYIFQEKYDPAIKYLEKGLKKDPSKNSYRLMLCDLYMFKKDYKNALKYYKELVQLYPKNLILRYNYAKILETLKKYSEA